MSRTTPVQTSFNGGELSRRLSARIDQGIYAIAVEQMVGWAPLVEGPAEAMPGTIHVAQAPGPCRLIRFEPFSTQGHVIEASAGKFRVYTNDALIAIGGVPVEVASPYSWADVQQLRTHHDKDVLYCTMRGKKPREFRRDGATAFSFADLELKNGPFEDRNEDKGLRVSASALSGDVTLTATTGIFAATDVGGLFQLEAEDFGDIPAWEPGITVTAGQLLTYEERVYRVVGGGAAMRTGGYSPVHTEGVEWDGVGHGTDINDKPAAGVQLEYVHDKIGILRITSFTSATEVGATVLRHLPFSSVDGNYDYTGGYYDPEWGSWVPVDGSVSYAYGTWRWRFGAFSDTRGHPESACIWNERLWLSKDNTVYGSASGDLHNFAVWNELGELTNDMALTAELPDPNPVFHMVGDDKLLILNKTGMFALGPAGTGSGVGPNNRRVDRQNNRSCGTPEPVALDSRTIYIDRSGRRVHEGDYDPGRNTEAGVDLTRYARHIGKSKFVRLAAQSLPLNHLWAVVGDGTLACAVYLPDEQVLGWGRRKLASGMLARDLCCITDPDGVYDQVWIAAEFGGAWHVLRMAQWREDGDSDVNAVMLDMAAIYDDAEPLATFTHPVLRNRTIDVVASGAWYQVETDAAGQFTLPEPATPVVAGLPYEAVLTGLPIESGGETGPARGKMARIGRGWIEVELSQGLEVGVPDTLVPLEQLQGDSPTDEGFAPESGIRIIEQAGDWTRRPRLEARRVAPFQATILAWSGTTEVQQR
ncbi:hypothetical protein [Novosphingobium sp. UBA1939]|uniref:hypothetical protein n=1 Tax=Novosphingobium sp. UBA1939 TaxID=1946982 RepID=UPI0025F0E6DB|nr:hypothetical protein [Novosphingobium sp. UBA1939]